MSITQAAGFGGVPWVNPAPCAPPAGRRRAFHWLAWVRPGRPVRPCLRDFDDRMLADIGLPPDTHAGTCIRPPNPWCLVQPLR